MRALSTPGRWSGTVGFRPWVAIVASRGHVIRRGDTGQTARCTAAEKSEDQGDRESHDTSP